MLYDLNVPWTATTTAADLERRISFLSSFGYHTIALNHSITSLPSQITNPIPKSHPFGLSPKTNLLTRCTLVISDPSQNHRLPQLVSHYDLVAVRPTTERAFLAACLNLSEHSIISLDLSIRYPFHFKPKPLMTAVNRGIRFEICYAQVVTGDSERRRNVIANVMAIVRGTRGRGLVVSSGAEGVLNVRPPADVVNLLGVWGLARERGLEAMGVNPRAVVVNEALKRKSFRGVVEIVNAGAAPGRSENVTTTGKAAKGEKGKQKSAGLNSDGTNTPQNNSKRKSEEPLSSGDGTPTMSKRQAKRMRLAMLKSENDGGSSNATTPGTTTPEPSSTIQTKANG